MKKIVWALVVVLYCAAPMIVVMWVRGEWVW